MSQKRHSSATPVPDLHGIENLFACICDLNGSLRGKRLSPDQLEKVLAGNVRLPLSLAGVDIWGEDIEDSELVFDTGDADGIARPTGRGIVPMDWTSRPTALVPLWLYEEGGDPFDGDPRQALRSILERYAARGLTPVVATELEFYLVDAGSDVPQPPRSPASGKRLDADGVLSLNELEEFDAFLNDVYDACQRQGIPADSAIAECGAGQFEINMLHVADALRAADDAVLFKRLVRGIARRHGFVATFMAKPYGLRSGNGFHVHFSLEDEQGNNVFDDGSERGAPLMHHAVAGLLQSMQENALVFAPHENSYRRLTPGAHAPSSVAWGYENRTVAVRIPGGSARARRIEHRVAGADANPYLVLSSVLGGALLGIEHGWQPSEPISGNAYARARQLPHLPLDWASATQAFAQGELAAAIYPARLRTMLVECKRQEQARFNRHVSDLEYLSYLETV